MKILFAECKIQPITKGKILIYEGDRVNKIYYIVSGYIKVYMLINSGEQRIVFIYKPGDVFPLTTYLAGSGTARFFYESISPVEVQILSAKQFEKKVKGNIKIGENLIQYTTNIDRLFLQRVNDMVTNSSSLSKVLSLLNFLMVKFGKGKDEVHINLPLTLKDIANMCGLNREEVAKQLVYLKNKGVVYSSNSFVINKAKLKILSKKT
jgi:CRP-like cAMP-binding protein